MSQENFILHYDQNHCKIYYTPSVNAVWIKWNGFSNHEKFMNACNASMDILKKYRATKTIVDNREAKVVSIESQSWLTNVWLPEAFQIGVRTSAIIVSKDVFNQLAVKDIVRNTDANSFETEYFQDLESALKWLANK